MFVSHRILFRAPGGFRCSAVVLAVLSACGTAMADDDASALTEPQSTVSVGGGNWSGPRPHFGVYDGMRASGLYGQMDADLIQRDNATGTWLKLKADGLGQSNASFRGEYNRQGDIGATLEADRITSDNPNTYTTRLQGIGSTTLTQGTNALPGTMKEVRLGTEREITKLGFYKNLGTGFDLNVSFKNEHKTGTRAWGRGQQPEFAVEPIDSTTQQLEMVLNYSQNDWQVSGGYNGSWYDNNYNLVSMTNAGLAINATNSTYLSLPQDSQAHQLFLYGGYNFTPTTRGSFKVEYATATQNAHLATADIATLAAASAPGSLKGEVNTTLIQLGVTSRPMQDLSVLAQLRYHDVDDKTPINHFVIPALGCTAATTCVDNTPLGYRTLSGKLEANYRLSDVYSLTAGIDQRSQDRTVPVSNNFGAGGADTQRVVPFRTKLDELTTRVEVRRALSDDVNGTVALSNAQRTGSAYVKVAGPGNGSGNGFVDISNLINPLNIADRERNKVRLAVDWSVSEKLNLQFNVEEGRDAYKSSAARPFGLHDGVAQLYGMDISYAMSDKWKLNAWYAYDFSQATQSGARASNGGGNAAVKDYTLEDTGNSLGFGLRGEATATVDVGADLEITHNLSKYQQTLTALAGGAGTSTVGSFALGLPDIHNKVVKLSMFAKVMVSKKAELRFDYIHEIWNTDDWTWSFANGTPFAYTAAGTGKDGTTVVASQNQVNDYLGVKYILKF